MAKMIKGLEIGDTVGGGGLDARHRRACRMREGLAEAGGKEVRLQTACAQRGLADCHPCPYVPTLPHSPSLWP